jgi:hypothetical protein
MATCKKCAGHNFDEWYDCCDCNTLVEIDTWIPKQSLLETVRLWLNEEVQFNGEYYARRRFSTAVDLENFLSERLK